MRKYIAISSLFFCALFVKAQNPSFLLSFDINRYQNSIIINWEIEGGNLCAELKVEHSTDSVNYVSIYEYPGICGNSTSNEKYSFTHSNPVNNSRNYYRINLNASGNSGTLGITFVKLEETGYVIFPMPLEQGSKLYFSNDNDQQASFAVHNSSGSRVMYLEGIRNNEIDLGRSVFPAGVYYFTIRVENDPAIEGKFIIIK
jgi:hypothetical protein